MSGVRQQIIATTCDLMERQGFHATGLNQIVKESGAPKGSLYYYFPEGKDELAEAAIAWAGQTLTEHIRTNLSGSEDAPTALRSFILGIAAAVERSGFRSGGPLTTVAMETAITNERLNRACRDAYALLQTAFAAKLVASGYTQAQAKPLATFITAAVEGGIILSRTYHTGDPLRLVAEQVGQLLQNTQR